MRHHRGIYIQQWCCPCAEDFKEHRLVIRGNAASTRAVLRARPTEENPVNEAELLERVDPNWLIKQQCLRTLAECPDTVIYHMPQLSTQGAFCIEAQLESIVLQYPGMPLSLNLQKRLQVSAVGSMPLPFAATLLFSWSIPCP